MGKIIEAVGTAVHSETEGLAEVLEAAMVKAIEQALADGISLSDTKEILRRKELARKAALESFHA